MAATAPAGDPHKQQYQFKLRYGEQVHANILAIQAADANLRALGTTKSFGSIVNCLFGATYQQDALLRLLVGEAAPAASMPRTAATIRELEAQLAEHIARREADAATYQRRVEKLTRERAQSVRAASEAAEAGIRAANTRARTEIGIS